MLINISPKKNSEHILEILNQNNVPMTLGRYGKGTATDVMMDYLGIGEKEKCITFSFLPLDMTFSISKKIKSKYRDTYSFVIPVSSVGGKHIMEHFSSLSEQDNSKTNNIKFNKELILIIANRGYIDSVMEVAREAGAPGGTVIHARGTGTNNSEKFFGVTLGAEKEMIFIVTDKEKKENIMRSIMEKVGSNTDAGSIVFSLPATEILN